MGEGRSANNWLQARILCGTAACLAYGILDLICCNLLCSGDLDIDANALGDEKKVKQDVGALLLQSPTHFLVACLTFEARLRLPLRQFQKLARLEIERHDQVLQRVELAPVARVAKFEEPSCQFVE